MRPGIPAAVATTSLAAALERAGRIEPNRRAVVAFIKDIDTQWWGGNIDDWQPNESLLSSRAALEAYRKLLGEFRSSRVSKAHAVMIYKDGTFAAVMLGVQTQTEAGELLKEAMDVVRSRSGQSWLKA
jgi:hypothetical protein